MVNQTVSAIDSLSPQIKEPVEKIMSELSALTADAEVENMRKGVLVSSSDLLWLFSCGPLLREDSPGHRRGRRWKQCARNPGSAYSEWTTCSENPRPL